jgi:hypothetical protein
LDLDLEIEEEKEEKLRAIEDSEAKRVERKDVAIREHCICPQALVVDDEPFNIIIIESLLIQQGIKPIDTAYNGKEAVMKVE